MSTTTMNAAQSTYTINMLDTETTAPWMRLVASYTPAAQDGGKCRYTATASTDCVEALEAALDSDDDVLSYAALLVAVRQ